MFACLSGGFSLIPVFVWGMFHPTHIHCVPRMQFSFWTIPSRVRTCENMYIINPSRLFLSRSLPLHPSCLYLFFFSLSISFFLCLVAFGKCCGMITICRVAFCSLSRCGERAHMFRERKEDIHRHTHTSLGRKHLLLFPTIAEFECGRWLIDNV